MPWRTRAPPCPNRARRMQRNVCENAHTKESSRQSGRSVGRGDRVQVVVACYAYFRIVDAASCLVCDNRYMKNTDTIARNDDETSDSIIYCPFKAHNIRWNI